MAEENSQEIDVKKLIRKKLYKNGRTLSVTLATFLGFHLDYEIVSWNGDCYGWRLVDTEKHKNNRKKDNNGGLGDFLIAKESVGGIWNFLVLKLMRWKWFERHRKLNIWKLQSTLFHTYLRSNIAWTVISIMKVFLSQAIIDLIYL